MWELTIKKAEHQRIHAFELWCWRRLLRVPWTARRSNQSILEDISSECHWNNWCWSWNSSTLATWCEELTHWKRAWCWEGLKVGEEGDDRGWDGWLASLTQWTWVWVNSGSCWWTGRPGMPQSMGSQRVRQDWTTELNFSTILSVQIGQRAYAYWWSTICYTNVSQALVSVRITWKFIRRQRIFSYLDALGLLLFSNS